MRVLLTGANGYIGLRLLPSLLEAGHECYLLVRRLERFPAEDFSEWKGQLKYLEADVLQPESLPEQPPLDAAYYFLHSMGAGEGFSEKEAKCAKSFTNWVDKNGCRQLIYLGGLSSESDHNMSEHMSSRREVGKILGTGSSALTVLKASIIVGSGSASFEIIRDLTEKLPFMVTPKWTLTRCQPIAIRNVIKYLIGVLGNQKCYGQTFDIGGPDVLTYQEMLQGYAKGRGLRRVCLPVPFLSPKLSSYWLYMMTTTSFPLAKSLVASLHIETICEDTRIREIIPQELLSYSEGIEAALSNIAQNRVPSVWYDSLASGGFNQKNLLSIHVPEHGVLIDKKVRETKVDRDEVITSIWSIGGQKGYPSMNWAWKLRGIMDRVVGGIGLRRGRRHPTELRAGDALDFWRVLLSDPAHGRLILYAEMKLPGEAWLEFNLDDHTLTQTATFRPKGLFGRLYWWMTFPFHLILFPRMVKTLAAGW